MDKKNAADHLVMSTYLVIVKKGHRKIWWSKRTTGEHLVMNCKGGNNVVALTRHYSSDEQGHQMMHQKNDDTRKTMSTLMASTRQMIRYDGKGK